MKKFLLVISVVIAFNLSANAQGKQLPNSGFENWEDVSVGQDEPVKWSSIKTSDNPTVNAVAPVNWGRSDTAHTGNYSVRLYNLASIVGAVATGSITNGRFHTTFNPQEGFVYSDFTDDAWNEPFTKRPDSVVVWVQYYPVGNDTLQAKFLLHKDSCRIGLTPDVEDKVVGFAQINLTGMHDTWVRVSAPIDYKSDDDPDYFLSVLTAGAGHNAVAGSMALYDDVTLIYGPQSVNNANINNLDVYYANGNLVFKDVPNKLMNSEVSVSDISGRVVYKGIINGSTINLSGLSLHQGIYVVSALSSEGSYVKKLLIK